MIPIIKNIKGTNPAMLMFKQIPTIIFLIFWHKTTEWINSAKELIVLNKLLHILHLNDHQYNRI